MSINEIESKVRELRQLQALIEEAQAEAENIRDAIKAHMGDSEELRAGEYKAVTASRLDSKALKAALPEVVERFTKTTTDICRTPYTCSVGSPRRYTLP